MSKLTILALPAPGFEDVCAAEVKEILRIPATAAKGVVSFSVASLPEACEYIYRAHTPSRVALELFSLQANDELADAIAQKLDEKTLRSWLPQDATFVVRAQTEDRQELEVMVGESLFTLLGNKVDLKQPDVTFLIIVEHGTAYFCIDLSGPDLGRRDYRIFLGAEALKGHVAASLVKLAGYQPKQTFLDIFCRNGIIPIEAALMATKRSPHFFGKEKFAFRKLPALREMEWEGLFSKIDAEADPDAGATIIAMDPGFNNISAAKKNAKIAGIVKTITFSRTDLHFLDAKFGKHAINTLVTLPPQPSVNLSKERVDAMLKDVFYQAEFVMKKGGTLALITRTGVDVLKPYAKEYGFALKNERKVWQGSAELTVLVFQN
ncbi:MAG TPA: THUMP domain-containing protein [Candidatus Binatia bacterium]|nr:THUMP domain-containing protein [Candidatus Binatia bacterium]